MFRSKNIRALADCVIGDAEHFPYRSSYYISQFFEDCDLPFRHDGSTRYMWAIDRLQELLSEPSSGPNALPPRFVHLFRTLMDRSEAEGDDADRAKALEVLNVPFRKEGYEAYFDESATLQFRHIKTNKITEVSNPHRPFAPEEIKKRAQLSDYLNTCSEDDLIEEVLLPMFRQLGYHRITAAGHADKQLEYGKDIWMRFTLPTMHVIYFGIQAKKGKIDSSGVTKSGNANVAEIYNQVSMMLGHEIFDPELSRRVLVDHAFIIAGGEITKQARNWIGGKLDQSKRAQILFMDRDDILNLFVVTNIPLPTGAVPDRPSDLSDDIPF
ncbi:restriction endonuclease [Rhizobium sp. FKY42]|uniref:restriction endonuclease n=1 Tax=Rhizobium sp. FKY42 TaxID=2562310 RepID=UPI0010BFE25F|nr:restriction endonuclease [Rhizobium sp. FKY42]